MNSDELSDAMKQLAAENAAVIPPADIESKVMGAFDAHQAKRTRWWFPALATALAAALALAAFLLHRPAPPPKIAEAPFVAIPYVAPPAPYERTAVMRMDVPLAALMAAGLEVHTVRPGGMVPADVLIGQDGRALAIRLIHKTI